MSRRTDRHKLLLQQIREQMDRLAQALQALGQMDAEPALEPPPLAGRLQGSATALKSTGAGANTRTPRRA